jgi:hypothetical protein
MRIQIPVVVEMTDDQVAAYGLEFGLPHDGTTKLMARHVVEDVRSYVLTDLQGSTLGQFADISIKGRA